MKYFCHFVCHRIIIFLANKNIYCVTAGTVESVTVHGFIRGWCNTAQSAGTSEYTGTLYTLYTRAPGAGAQCLTVRSG